MLLYRWATLAVLAATVCFGCELVAQESGSPSVPPAKSSGSQAVRITLNRVKLEQGAKFLGDHFGVDFVIPPSLRDLEIDLDLRAADLETVLVALQTITEGKLQYQIITNAAGRVVFIDPPAAVNRLSQSQVSPRIDIDIEGGFILCREEKKPATISFLATYLCDRFPGVNIVLSPEAQESSLVINDLKLRSATLSDVATALQVASGSAVHFQSVGKNGMTYAVELRRIGASANRRVEAINLAPYLDKTITGTDTKANREKMAHALETINEMVYETVRTMRVNDVNAQEEQPRLRFYDEAKLLIVVGSPAAVETAVKIVKALNEQALPFVLQPTEQR